MSPSYPWPTWAWWRSLSTARHSPPSTRTRMDTFVPRTCDTWWSCSYQQNCTKMTNIWETWLRGWTGTMMAWLLTKNLFKHSKKHQNQIFLGLKHCSWQIDRIMIVQGIMTRSSRQPRQSLASWSTAWVSTLASLPSSVVTTIREDLSSVQKKLSYGAS